MKILCLLLFPVFFAASQVPIANSSGNKCLDLSGMINGELTFEVNTSSKSQKLHGGYQRDYVVLVYEDRKCTKLVSGYFFLRKSNYSQLVKLDIGKAKDYCVVIHKERIIIGEKQMEWANDKATKRTASLWDRNKLNYYASTANFLIPTVLATTTVITSKDGAGGDGVRVMID